MTDLNESELIVIRPPSLPCEFNNCQNSSTCIDLPLQDCTCPGGGARCSCVNIQDYKCNCLPGFTGNQCETNINECDPNPCLNESTCMDGVNGYTCDCNTGFDGLRCENINDCDPDPCLNASTCVDGVNGYTCDCQLDWRGVNCGTITFSNSTIRPAIQLWVTDKEQAINIYGHISTWDVSNVTNMARLFIDLPTFNEDISQWDVSNVTNMTSMFENAKTFNQDLDWDVRNVESMQYVFKGAELFNGDISNWDMRNTRLTSNMFEAAYAFNRDISKWNVSNVTDMGSMFAFTRNFSQYLNDWDVSNVSEMGEMFAFSNFNGNISSWNVSNLTGAAAMFYEAVKFNGDLTRWDVSRLTGILTDELFVSADSYTKPCDRYSCNNGICSSSNNFNYQCNCDPGFKTNFCEININECGPDTCLNGSTCVDGVNGYTCECLHGFSGPRCGESTSTTCQGWAEDPQNNGGQCDFAYLPNWDAADYEVSPATEPRFKEVCCVSTL